MGAAQRPGDRDRAKGEGIMEARNRALPEWFERIRTRQITLPRFQRMEAWGPGIIEDLLTAVLRGLPCGATLILEVGDELPFISRPLEGAPEDGERVTELLLDGQQRLTALWRSMHDDYPDRTYLLGFEDDPHRPGEKQAFAVGQARWWRNGQKYPRWVDRPDGTWKRGYIPLRLLRPGDVHAEIDEWIEAVVGEDYKAFRTIDRQLSALRQQVATYNIPFLSLPMGTAKDVSLNVFIKMNTSYVRLSPFDIIVAQLEEAAGESLHDMLAGLNSRIPHAEVYKSPEDLILDVAALMQDRVPNQTGYQGLDLEKLVEEWEQLVAGVEWMVDFLTQESVFDSQRLPTDAVLAVLSALHGFLPDRPDELGNARTLLRKYVWRAFLTNRYEQAAATSALQDFRGLRDVLTQAKPAEEVPIFNENMHPLPTSEELKTARWPKNKIILARGILGLAMKCGAHDIADDAPATRDHIQKREYHHLFPAALLRSAELPDDEIYRALNCALITWRTNRALSDKEPLKYLRERAEANALGEEDLQRRLRTHIVPYATLCVGDYEAMYDEQRKERIKMDYEGFLRTRAELVKKAVDIVCSGRTLSRGDLFEGQIRL